VPRTPPGRKRRSRRRTTRRPRAPRAMKARGREKEKVQLVLTTKNPPNKRRLFLRRNES